MSEFIVGRVVVIVVHMLREIIFTPAQLMATNEL